MTYIVENGIGLADANAYCTLDYADSYVSDYYGSITEWSGATNEQKERAGRVATQYIDLKYGHRAERKLNSSQALAFPQYTDTEVLKAVKKATVEAMILQLKGGDLIAGVIEEPGMLKREKVKAGPVETEEEYVGGKSQVPCFPKINALMSQVLGNPNQIRRG